MFFLNIPIVRKCYFLYGSNMMHKKRQLLGFVKRDFKLRYKKSFLGLVWSLSTPFLQIIVYFIVFNIFQHNQIPHYAFFLVIGVLTWQWVFNSINITSSTLIQNSSLIKSINFDKSILIASGSILELFQFCLFIPVLFLISFLFTHDTNLQSILYALVFLVPSFLFTYSLSLLFSLFSLFYKDHRNILSTLSLIIFFTSPVFYSHEHFSPFLKKLMLLNPVASFINIWRSLVYGISPSGIEVITFLVWTTLLLGLATWIFKHAESSIVEKLS